MKPVSEAQEYVIKQEIQKRAQSLSMWGAVRGTVYFFYYLTAGYFTNYEKHLEIRYLIKFL